MMVMVEILLLVRMIEDVVKKQTGGVVFLSLQPTK
jgi:hypothetical protein